VASGQLQRLRARDLMTPLVLSVRQGTPIARAAALMAAEGVHRLPVVNENNRIVGLVSSIDVLRWVGRAVSP
jgi:CBS domain-containing protein